MLVDPPGMRILIRLVLLACVIAGLVFASQRGRSYWKERNRPKFRTAELTEGPITAVVNSTGEVKPVLSISVGSFVSGPDPGPARRLQRDGDQRPVDG